VAADPGDHSIVSATRAEMSRQWRILGSGRSVASDAHRLPAAQAGQQKGRPAWIVTLPTISRPQLAQVKGLVVLSLRMASSSVRAPACAGLSPLSGAPSGGGAECHVTNVGSGREARPERA
jgi:hypothetical protein